MKKIMISLLMVAATLNAMAVTYSGKVKVRLTSSDNNYCEAVVATSDDFSDGLNNGYYAPFNDENKDVHLYVDFAGTRYAHFGSSETTMRNMPLILKANSATDYTLSFSAMVGAIDIYDRKENVHIDKSANYNFSIEASERDANDIVANRFVINYTYVIMNGDFADPGNAWAYTSNFAHNGATASLDLDLAADTWYHFQIEENGNIGANGSAFDSDHTSHVVPTTGWESQLTLHSDLEGTYTFTWEYATKTLTITFPVAPVPTCVTVRDNLEIGRYYTICLPQDIVSANGASFWDLSHRGTDVAYLEEAVLPLEPGRPYIFQAEAEELCVIYGNEVPAADAGAHGALVGTFAAMNQAALNAAVAANDGSDIYLLFNNELIKVNGQSGNSLVANRAYIVYNSLIPGNPQSAPGRRVRAIPMQGQTATGVENLNASEAPVKTMIDGTMYIIRGEHMFDATGRMVK